MNFWNKLIGLGAVRTPKYKKGDWVELKQSHNSGNEVGISEVLPNCEYKVYIPYFGYFIIREDVIVKKLWGPEDVE